MTLKVSFRPFSKYVLHTKDCPRRFNWIEKLVDHQQSILNQQQKISDQQQEMIDQQGQEIKTLTQASNNLIQNRVFCW